MQQPIPTNPLPEPPKTENKYPECLVLEIQGIPISQNDPTIFEKLVSSLTNRNPQEKPKDYLELSLSIQFNEHENFPIPGGTITFGIRKGN